MVYWVPDPVCPLSGLPSMPDFEFDPLPTEIPPSFAASFGLGGVECPLTFTTENGGDIRGVIVMYF